MAKVDDVDRRVLRAARVLPAAAPPSLCSERRERCRGQLEIAVGLTYRPLADLGNDYQSCYTISVTMDEHVKVSWRRCVRPVNRQLDCFWDERSILIAATLAGGEAQSMRLGPVLRRKDKI